MVVLLKILILFFLLLLTSALVSQLIGVAVGLLNKLRFAEPEARTLHRYAAVISARNEEGVIGGLVQSLKAQNYPADKLDIFVVADNCTDRTAEAAAKAGATVFRRWNQEEIGKGYALDFLFRRIRTEYAGRSYAGFLIFDADNYVDPNFVLEINKTYDSGNFDAITSYRSSKNFGANWISAGYSIWFLRQARFLNFPRSLLGLNCAVGGTGFFVSSRLIRENGGWPFHLLTEDIEFSADCAVRGCPIGYCDRAVIFDEQPTVFTQSWDQRLRWSKGFYQVDAKYGLALARESFHGGRHGVSCWDMLTNLMPGLYGFAGAGLFAALAGFLRVTRPAAAAALIGTLAVRGLALLAVGYYGLMLLTGLVTVLTEWRRIPATTWQKLRYLPLFPLFMLTYLPIAVTALFRKVEWKPIRHTPEVKTEQV
ncbi:MAG: glycosyltransferase [Oscillibacter sp.]|jgi:cellulose synthase/poly-beta-1,6-N-acetylglucosamine synthase-like glycosyltransferase|nr:glycosyltransferase [Oscillibacter sp.]